MKACNNLLIMSLGILLTTCNGYLDTNPSNGIGIEKAITSEADVETALRGAYDGLTTPLYYGADLIIYGDVKGDDVQSFVRGPLTVAAYTFSWNEINSPLGFWQVPYAVIGSTNFILQELQKGVLPETKFVQDAMGQAFTLRALCHFNLLRMYGYPYLKDEGRSLGIPLAKRILTANDFLARNTVAEGYDMIIDDLLKALKLTNNNIKDGFINQWAVKSLLARVFLYKGNWEQAFIYASDVIENSPYRLVLNENYLDSWTEEYTTESIFDLHISKSSSFNSALLGYLVAITGNAAVTATVDLVNLLNEEPGDIRLKLLKEKPATGRYFIQKYPGRDGMLAVNNIKVIRLSDIYLIAAEAALKKNEPDQKIADYYLNRIRQRGSPNAATVIATEELVLKERRKELFLEGHRFFDMMRLGKTIVRKGGFHFLTEDELIEPNWNDYRIILPIPLLEIDANPNIRDHQNPGY